MPYELRLFCVGAAAVIDTALLLSICERTNWRRTAMPIVTLTLGVWLFHGGEFANLLLRYTVGDWAEVARVAVMSAMSIGLLLMPSAMLHGALRVRASGFRIGAPPRRILSLAYCPLLLAPLVVISLAKHPGALFLDRLTAYLWPYLVFSSCVNVFAIAVFHLERRRTEPPEQRRFLLVMECFLAVLTVCLGITFALLDEKWQQAESPLLLIIVLSPVIPAMLFAYFAIRYRFMRLIVERSFVYGVIVAAALLLHHLILFRIADPIADQFRIDLGIMEGVIVFLLVVLYQPFRQRAGDALRTLLGRSHIDIRHQTQTIAIEMWNQLDKPPTEVLDWFTARLQESFQLKSASAWIINESHAVLVRSDAQRNHSSTIAELHQSLDSHSYIACRGPTTVNQRAFELLTELNGSLAARVDHEGVSGLLLLGRGRRAKELSEEETSAILLLVELLAVTLNNQQLQQKQIETERRASQNEKLTTLGLLTSCITHEIKNPLSSIKTIATLLAERISSEDGNAEDLQIILDEVERLTETTNQFLKFARPTSADSTPIDVHAVFQGVAHVLSHIARKYNVDVIASCSDQVPSIACPEDALRQIAFNLVLNAIEASPNGGRVDIDISVNEQNLTVKVTDKGEGIPEDVMPHIFEPLVTTKDSGTGIGLYVVSRNVDDIGGTIDCENLPDGGTCFTIRLPLDKLRCTNDERPSS